MCIRIASNKWAILSDEPHSCVQKVSKSDMHDRNMSDTKQ